MFMYRNKVKNIFVKNKLVLLFLVIPLVVNAQINVEAFIKQSSIASTTNNKLYFVDFWATWCGPCVAVSKYLTGLQRQYPEHFYIVSLTQENPELVKRFIEKHALDLAVAVDFEGETFSKYNITSLPYGVLFNASGTVLWEGHPAEFKWYQLEHFLKQQKEKRPINDMFVEKSSSVNTVTLPSGEDTFVGDFEIKVMEDAALVFSAEKKKNYLELKGDLKNILAYTYNVFKAQIDITSNLNKNYVMRFKYNSPLYKDKANTILKCLKFRKSHYDAKGEILFFNLDTPRFWDTQQIEWGEDTPNFLIGDSEIKANDVSLNELNYTLANLLELPIITNKAAQLTEAKHDWEIHYKYFNLMASTFQDTYGITVKKQHGAYPMYVISK